jgi:hypothetical protein
MLRCEASLLREETLSGSSPQNVASADTTAIRSIVDHDCEADLPYRVGNMSYLLELVASGR